MLFEAAPKKARTLTKITIQASRAKHWKDERGDKTIWDWYWQHREIKYASVENKCRNVNPDE